MIRIGCSVLLCVLALASLCEAQNKFRFDHLTSNQGLANNIVYAMLQDSQGYMWFATDNGLCKYDGYTFTTYRKTPGDANSLVGNSVIYLLEGSDGYIWIGMMGQGICKFDRRREQFSCYGPNPNTLTQGTIASMCTDQDGNLWVSNRGPELRRFDPQTGQYSRVNYASLLPPTSVNGKSTIPRINNIYRDKTGTIWVCSEVGLHRMNLKKVRKDQPEQVSFTTYRHDSANAQSLSHDNVWEIFEDHAGFLWLSTHQGLNRFDPKTGVFTLYQYDLVPPSISEASYNHNFGYFAEDQQGNLWMGTYKGLVRFDPVSTQFTPFQHDPAEPSSLSSNFVRAILVDEAGLLWVSLWGEGVDKTNPGQQPFQHYRPLPDNPASLSNKYIDAILEDRSGTLWIGTGDGLDKMNKQTGTFKHYRHDPNNPKSLPHRYVAALLEDRDGNLWVGSEGELFLFNRQTEEFTAVSRDTRRYPGLGGNIKIFALYQDRQGLIWLGTTNGIKSFDSKTGTVVHYPHNPQNLKGISDPWAISLLEDKRGNLWVGTGSVALNRLNRKTGLFTHYRPNRRKPGSITSDAVPSIFQDSKDNLWLGTSGGGLCRFDFETETFQSFTQADGLGDNSIFSIQEDKQGQLWLATSRGLSRFSFATRTFSNYDVNDGLPDHGFRHANYKGKDGILYFGGDNGVTSVDPQQLRANSHSPRLVITQAKLFDKPISNKVETGSIDFNYDENFFSFEFAALDFTNPSKNRYAYQLVGLEKDWVYSGSRRYASYTNLDPGAYVFRVMGSNNDGFWNEKGASIRVIIHPPWWKTPWFRLLAVLCLVLLVGGSVRVYTQTKLRRQRNNMTRIIQTQESERQRLAADLHDDLGGTLATIRRRLSDIRQRMRDPEAANEMDALEPLIQKSTNDLRRIAHNLMPPEFERIGLRHALEQLIDSQPTRPTRFSFVVAGTEKKLPYDTELNIYRIVSELVQNIHKHAQAQQAAVQMLYYDDYLSITVEDNGLGSRIAKTEQRDVGIGLKNSSLRAEYIGTKLWREVSESGTLIVLNVPYATLPDAASRIDPNFTD